jgi:putative protease
MTDKSGRTHIFNSKEMCLLEDISHLLDAGVSRFRIDARIAEPSLTGQVVSSYRDAIDSYYEDKQPINKKCRDISKEFTRGHYHRGIL